MARPMQLVLAPDEIPVPGALRAARVARLGGARGAGGGEQGEGQKCPEHVWSSRRQWAKVRQKMKIVMAALRQEMTMRAGAGSILRA